MNPRSYKFAPFFYGAVLGVVLVYGAFFADTSGLFSGLIDRVYAVVNNIEPELDGTIAGTPNSCGATNASCLSDGVTQPTAPNTTDFVNLVNGASDYYLMETLPSVSSATQVVVQTYHKENSGTMATYVSLWDATELIQYGTEVQLPNLVTAGWSPATFASLSLSQAQLDGLRVRLFCDRPGGGKSADCEEYAMYAEVTYTEAIDVVVSTTGTQGNVAIEATNTHIGGAFVISEDTGSRNITSITVQEQGTVDALTDLANIKLYYELATNCATEGYGTGGVETQFGATDTNGFSEANGTSVFTDSIAVTTANDMCVYVVLDVLGSATWGETIEVQITDPSADVVGSGSPVVSPATAILLSGTTVLEESVLTQTRYHWRQDNGNQTDAPVSGADSATAGTQNNPLTKAQKSTNYRLRLEVDNEGNTTSDAVQYRLEYATKVTDCSVATGWIDVHASADDWDMVASPNIADGNTTNITDTAKGALTDDGTNFIGTGALRETTSLSSSITLASDEFTELEYSIIPSASIVDGTNYCFRVTDNGTELDSYTEYPEASFSADMTVSAEEAQVSTASIPSTNVLIGAFHFSSTSVSSRDVDSITITASSTADVTTDFDNIKLFWEYDTSVPIDCASETYGGGLETQYGATDADGFSSSGTSTFTQALLTPSVAPTQALCLYVLLDVTSAATDGEAIDIQILDPSTDVVLSAGTAAPASLVELSGTTVLTQPLVTQTGFHWRDNDGTEAGASSLTAGVENTKYTDFPALTTSRIRFGVHNSGGESSGNYQYQLEWGQRVSTCAAVATWVDVDTGGDEWSVVSSQLVDNADTTDVLVANGGVTNTGSFKATNGGQQDVDAQTGNVDLAADDFVALEYSIQASSAVTEGASYCFKVTNAGTDLDVYTEYAETSIKLGTDFVVTRGSSVITGTSLTLFEESDVSATVDYDLQLNDPTRAFIRITNSQHTGGGTAAGSTGNNNADDVTAYISNPGNIATSVNLARFGVGDDTRVSWEVIEYVGEIGGDNEIVVRSAAVATYGTAATSVTTGTISGVVTDGDVVPFITGQATPDTGRANYNEVLSTAAWNAGADTTTFTRGQTGDAVAVSHAIIEFTGANWKIQRREMLYTAAGVATTSPINAIGSLSKAFIHAQHSAAGTNLDTHADFGHEVWLSSVGNVSFRLDGDASVPAAGDHVSVAWVVENTQAIGDVMYVQRKDIGNSLPDGGGGLTVTNVTLTTEIDDLSTASLFINSRSNEALNSFPEPMISAEIISTTQFQLQESDDGSINVYRIEIMEWPTASRKLTQNDFRLYEDNDGVTPVTAWSGLPENAEMTVSDTPMISGELIRIRMNLLVSAAAMPAGVDAFRLQFGERETTCSAVANWLNLGNTASTTAEWRGNAASPADGATLPSTLLAASTIAGTYEEENNSALTPTLALVNDNVEFDWNIEHNGAKDKSDYCFRMTEADQSPLTLYSTYPVIRTAGYGPVIGNWRFYDDELSLTPTVGLGAGENSAPSSIDNSDIIKLRATFAEKSGATGDNVKFKVQYSEYPDFSTAVFDVTASTTCTATSTWCYADGAGVDNAVIDAKVISDADSCSGGTGLGCGTHNEGTSTVAATFDHTAFSNAEFEFTLENAGARVNAVYYFRFWNIATDEAVLASSTYPSLMSATSSLTFTVGGLSSGTAVGSITTDVTTTAESISFTSIPFDTEYEAAQRLTIDTNATEGYQILVFTDQALTNSYGGTIAAVSGTNAAPSSWLGGCATPSLGCFGYHTTDVSLQGGDNRFGADDTYASFTTTPQEVMYRSTPIAESHDIVYKIQVGQEQPAGDYQKSITYIAVPVF